MPDNQTTAPLGQLEREALTDIHGWGPAPYVWKQASMRKLAARGLVKKIGTYGGLPMWELTEEGRRHP